MDLAEEEHRLRDEWVTYRNHGFRFREPTYLSTDVPADASDPQRLHLWVTAMLDPPPGASPVMVDDARRWARRWLHHVGRSVAADLLRY